MSGHIGFLPQRIGRFPVEGTAKRGESMRWRERVWGREELLGIPSEWGGGASPMTSEPFALPFLSRLLRARLAKGEPAKPLGALYGSWEAPG